MSDAGWVEQTHFTDKAGRNVSVGDTIVYGHALGRCAGLRFGRVLAIRSAEVKLYRGATRTDWSIRVQGVDDDWGGKEVKLCRPGTLGFPSRIVKVDPYLLPDAVKAALEGVAA